MLLSFNDTECNIENEMKKNEKDCILVNQMECRHFCMLVIIWNYNHIKTK